MSELVAVGQDSSYLRASRYVFENGYIRAAPDATWSIAEPLRYETPPRNGRSMEGPHLALLKLRNLARERSPLYGTACEVFASRYGLFGLVYDRYAAPILPAGKLYIAPSAVLSDDGKLERIDPHTDGRDALDGVLGFKPRRKDVAVPRELSFGVKRRTLPGEPDPAGGEVYSETARWKEVRDGYGAVMVLDATAPHKSRLLGTAERVWDWSLALPDLPRLMASGAMSLRDALVYLNGELAGNVSPYASEGEDGEAVPGWRCPSLLAAVHFMSYRDLTSGAKIRECGLSDCFAVFRVGQQAGALYCSKAHASLASTRRSRGKPV